MGKDVVRGGTKAILERYQKSYPTREKMGTLTFSELVVRPLAKGLALTTGKFFLKRTAEGGGDFVGPVHADFARDAVRVEDHPRPYQQ